MTRVALFVTCVGDLLTPEVPMAAARVLAAAGDDVTVPAGQTCCGQPAWNAGFAADAAKVAAASLEALEAAVADGAEVVVVPAGSCATMIRLYWPAMFDGLGDGDRADRARAVSDRVREVTEHLVERGGAPGVPAVAPCTVALHKSCHLERELHVRTQPRQLLDGVAGCTVADWEADDRCCGFGGTFSVRLPEVSAAMADDKLDTLPAGVGEIIGTDASCLLQLRARAEQRGLPVTTRHVVEVLAGAIEPTGGARP